MPREKRGDVALPVRPFLYTLEQVATLTAIEPHVLRDEYVWYEGVNTGGRPPRRLLARDVHPLRRGVDWRVAENELIRWMRACNFRVMERETWIVS